MNDTPNPNRMLEEWRGFRAAVIPPDAPGYQLRAMQMAFFAGGTAAVSMIMREADEGDAVTAADEMMMDNLWAELVGFGPLFVATVDQEGPAIP